MNRDTHQNRFNEKEVIGQSPRVSGHKPEIRFIITHQTGQMGNHLIMFAHFIASALENNQKVVNLAFYKYAKLFESTSKDVFCRYPPKHSFVQNSFVRKPLYDFVNVIAKERIRKRLIFLNSNKISDYRDHKEFRLDAPGIFTSTGRRQIIFVDGFHFRDYINFLKYADEIKKYFVPLASHKANISNLINKARNDCEVLVGIHVRRGDYKYFKGGKYYHEIDTYIEVMNKVKKLFPNKKVGFLVCSDEVLDKNKFCRQNTTFGTGHILEDMYSFACCDYILGPPSSYTRWASFYGDVPLYSRRDPNEEISIDNFLSYEKRVHRHMKYSPNYPRFTVSDL